MRSDARLSDDSALARERKQRQIALDVAELGTWRHDWTTQSISLDPRAQRHYGMSEAEVPVAAMLDRVHPEDRPRVLAASERFLSGPAPDRFETEYRVVHDDGTVRLLRVRVLVELAGEGSDRRPAVGYGTSQDVTDAQQTQRLLREQTQLLHEVEELAQVGGWNFDLRTGEGAWTRETCRIHGVERPSRADEGLDRFEGEARRRIETALAEARERGVPYDLELPFVAADGARKWVRAVCRPVQEGGRVVRLRGFLQDITERRRAEMVLERFMRASPSILYALAIEPQGPRPVWLDGDLERLTGWQPSEAQRPFWWAEHLHPEDREQALASFPSPYAVDHASAEFRLRRRDGSYLWVHDERRLLRDAEGRPAEVVGSWTDVTARVELEARLRQSQKLEAIGQLAGGIAHDFNNLLTVVIGCNEALSAALPPDAEAQQHVEDLRTATDRAASLTRQLLAFTRQQVLRPAEVDLNAALDRLQRVLRRLIGDAIRVRCELAPDAGHVLIDPGQLEQVVFNLAVNARDAMPEGGVFTLRTERLAAPDRVRLTLTDDGEGMTPAVQARIFEPFFTTKPAGLGTGLGLATVANIVRGADGRIDVKSAPGAGTTISIVLPRTVPRTDGKRPASAVRAGSEHVWVVDDDESVRRVSALSLTRYGYHVREVQSADEALRLEASGASLDLLVTDVVMPGTSGPALAAALCERRPGLRALFLSGYVQDAATQRALAEGAHAFLAKPFKPRDLADRVRAVLDAPSVRPRS